MTIVRIEPRLLRAAAILLFAVVGVPWALAGLRRNVTNLPLLGVITSHPVVYSPCNLPIGPKNGDALRLVDTAAARAVLPGDFRNAGSAMLAAGDAARAGANFDRALRQNRSDVIALLRQAQIASAGGDVVHAAALLRVVPQATAVRIASNGDHSVEVGEARGAARCFDIAIALDDNAFEGHLGKGRLLLRQHDANGAFAELDRAVALCPRCGDPIFYRAYARLMRGDRIDLVERDLRTAVDLAPDDVSILSGWARYLGSAFRTAEAERVWRRVRERS
jgi:tetratricopeptide (TPR) repeat protein